MRTVHTSEGTSFSFRDLFIRDCFLTCIVSNNSVCFMFDATKPHYVYAIDCSYLSKCDIVLVDIVECSSSPCENGAMCTDAVEGYACACIAGYTGIQCETGERMGLSNTYNLGKCSKGELSVKLGYTKVLISTGEYYEETLPEENIDF